MSILNCLSTHTKRYIHHGIRDMSEHKKQPLKNTKSDKKKKKESKSVSVARFVELRRLHTSSSSLSRKGGLFAVDWQHGMNAVGRSPRVMCLLPFQ